MPTVLNIRTKHKRKRQDSYLLLKEGEEFSLGAVIEIKRELEKYAKEYPDCSSEELLIVAEDFAEKFNGTIIPFRLFVLNIY